MPDVLKCPECDANADVTKDVSQVNTHIVLRIAEGEYKRRERADGNTGNNIFEPKQSPDMKEGKEGEKGESK
ncbi:hypothetical protein E4T44_04845 [Aureobasidium sp. EXF-8845]|nr:hypothetical protein E4T44_04845 [Aureobasidium sp. EXF-8845]KAI4850954.1 hypothetical protein E4T45_05280 [Aureobasidium sp. EXF-8846]